MDSTSQNATPRTFGGMMPHRGKAWNGRCPPLARRSGELEPEIVANYRREAFSPQKTDRMDPSSGDVLHHPQMNGPQRAPLSCSFWEWLASRPVSLSGRMSPLRDSQGLSSLVGNQTQKRSSHDAGARLSLSLCLVSFSGRSTFLSPNRCLRSNLLTG